MTEVANTHGLGDVGASGHSELHGLLDVVAIPVPLVQERSEGAVAGANGRDQLDVELTLGIPDVLAVGEVGVAAATTGEQHVLDAGVVGELHGNANLVVGVDRHAEDGLHLVMVRLDEQRLLVSELLELVGGQVQDDVGATSLSVLHDLSQEVGRSFGRHGTRDDQALKIARGVQDVVELLLVLRRNRGAGVKDAILVLAIVDVGVDTRDTVGPDRAAQAAQIHDLLDDKLAREASEKAERDGVDAHLLKGEGHVEALTVGRVAGRAGADILVGLERRARNRHVDSRISG